MEPITETMIDMTWHDMSHLTPEAAQDGIMSLGEEQPALLDFFMPYSEALQPDSQSFAVFLFYTTFKLFINAYGDPKEKVGDDEIEAIYDRNEAQLGDLETLDRAAIAEGLKEGAFVQPQVIDFVADLLYGEVGAEEEDDFDDYERYDRGMTFLLIKTVIDALDTITYEEYDEK